jgi:penicillin amidase
MKRTITLAVIAVLSAATAHGDAPTNQSITLPQLEQRARAHRDSDGVWHVYAYSERDALFLQGWLQAQDRLFQIDVQRRTASGTLAELVGPNALASDVQLRTIGLRRAAQRSLDAYAPDVLEGLQAYAEGVNAWVAANPLPAQYAALKVAKFEPWTALDSAVIGKALGFQLSFDLDIDPTLIYLEYQKKLAGVNPQLPDALYFLDVFRSAPFDKAATVPDATGKPPFLGPLGAPASSLAAAAESAVGASPASASVPEASLSVDAATEKLLRRIDKKFRAVPFLRNTLTRTEQQIGSNEWAVAGSKSVDGRPLVANDPHLSLDLPPNFYQIHLVTKDGLDVLGSSIAGTPWVVLGQNANVTWGETTTGFDVTDTYQEKIQALPTGPNELPKFVTFYQGQPEPVTVIPVTFKANVNGNVVPIAPTPQNGIPPVVLTVPRRNNGPIVDLDIDPNTGAGTAISVQYTGFSGTRELQTFARLNRASNLDEFVEGLQYFDVGSQNFIYGDVDGNIGYFSTAEVPLREDLQASTVAGAPPWFIRNGQGGNEWLKDPNPDAFNGTGYLSLPFAELPQTVNPVNGFVVNANNDPAGVTLNNNPVDQLRPGGQGIYYLGYTFDFGTRAGRITQALKQELAKGPVDKSDMKAIQADVKLLDAEVLTPYITGAFQRASKPGANPALAALAGDAAVAEAVGRLRSWNHTTPTGVATGYDASDKDGNLKPPTASEVKRSIAATIYSVWRSKAIANGVDLTLQGLGVPTPGSGEAIKALRHLMERSGIGLSTVDFFGWAPLPTAAERRDFVALKSLKDALDALAGPDFQAAFKGSTNQEDYKWGRLHRIVFDGVIVGGPFSIPGATPGLPPSFPDLSGLATDGGFGVVDASSHSARAANSNAFMFGSGPNRRYVGSPGTAPGSIGAETSLPGGISGTLGSPFYANLLKIWLTNDTFPLRQPLPDVLQNLDGTIVFNP